VLRQGRQHAHVDKVKDAGSNHAAARSLVCTHFCSASFDFVVPCDVAKNLATTGAPGTQLKEKSTAHDLLTPYMSAQTSPNDSPHLGAVEDGNEHVIRAAALSDAMKLAALKERKHAIKIAALNERVVNLRDIMHNPGTMHREEKGDQAYTAIENFPESPMVETCVDVVLNSRTQVVRENNLPTLTENLLSKLFEAQLFIHEAVTENSALRTCLRLLRAFLKWRSYAHGTSHKKESIRRDVLNWVRGMLGKALQKWVMATGNCTQRRHQMRKVMARWAYGLLTKMMMDWKMKVVMHARLAVVAKRVLGAQVHIIYIYICNLTTPRT
jgi:hypothetical protein